MIQFEDTLVEVATESTESLRYIRDELTASLPGLRYPYFPEPVIEAIADIDWELSLRDKENTAA